MPAAFSEHKVTGTVVGALLCCPEKDGAAVLFYIE
ncbi:hypothetical protein PRIO_1924 [Paenibacillus riograndensis SBR5]|uniref:Uncharacterized protein n=1 Tax=Paenibacillus riograndensis SBR5 TaxID=1073571 RepID=A0A0E4H8K8_9BACL|nr:hypothetical protein PRIO_1924 [Paenibacillus riograndensis SBR5]